VADSNGLAVLRLDLPLPIGGVTFYIQVASINDGRLGTLTRIRLP